MKLPSKRLVIKLSAVFAVLLALLVAFWSLWLLKANRQLKRAHEFMVDSGMSAEPAELLPVLPPGAQNSAPLYQSIFAIIESKSAPEGGLGSWANKISNLQPNTSRSAEEEMKFHEEYLRAWESEEGRLVWQLIELAVTRGPAVFDLDYDQGVYLAMPHLQAFGSLQKLLREKISSELMRGRHDEARETLLVSLQVANALELDPMLISQLIRLSLYQSAGEAMADLLSSVQVDEAYIHQLQSALQPLNNTNIMSRAVMSEYHIFYKTLYDWFESDAHPSLIADMMGEGSNAKAYKLYTSALLRPLRREDMAHITRIMTLCSKKQEYEQYAEPEELNDFCVEDYIDHEVPSRSVFVRMMAPSLNKNYSSRALGLYRTMMLTIELYARATTKGEIPENLSELALQPDLTRNPYTGKDIAYEKSGSGFSLDLEQRFADPLVITLPALY